MSNAPPASGLPNDTAEQHNGSSGTAGSQSDQLFPQAITPVGTSSAVVRSRSRGGEKRGIVLNIQRFSVQDGPGIRTTVFLKGCPLKCAWCHNPESQETLPEPAVFLSRCAGSGECVDRCRHGAITWDGSKPHTDLIRCIVCGICVNHCPTGARVMYGLRMRPSEVVTEALKDQPFYEESGGGVTFSGGEPLDQPDFLLQCLSELKRRGTHTAVDTCGFAPTKVLAQIAELADMFLYDLKLMGAAEHRQYTGVSNRQILRNLRFLAGMGKRVWLRFPVIPAITDTEENLRAMSEFALSLETVPDVYLLPYHTLAEDKHKRLHRTYSLEGMKSPAEERMGEIRGYLEQQGLTVRIGG